MVALVASGSNARPAVALSARVLNVNSEVLRTNAP